MVLALETTVFDGEGTGAYISFVQTHHKIEGVGDLGEDRQQTVASCTHSARIRAALRSIEREGKGYLRLRDHVAELTKRFLMASEKQWALMAMACGSVRSECARRESECGLGGRNGRGATAQARA